MNKKILLIIGMIALVASVPVISWFSARTEETIVESKVTELHILYEKISKENDPKLIYIYGRKIDTLQNILNNEKDSLKNQFYVTLAKESSRKFNISNWKIIYGIWTIESKLDPKAKGDGLKDSNGVFIPGTWRAFGLGQVWLSTAKFHYDKNITKNDLLDPVICGYVSAKIYKDYLDIFGGNEIYAIAAYQKGPGGTMNAFKSKIQPSNSFSYIIPVLLEATRVKEL